MAMEKAKATAAVKHFCERNSSVGQAASRECVLIAAAAAAAASVLDGPPVFCAGCAREPKCRMRTRLTCVQALTQQLADAAAAAAAYTADAAATGALNTHKQQQQQQLQVAAG